MEGAERLWLEKHIQIRTDMEQELEAAGVVAYMTSETEIVLIMANGSLLKIEAFFYPECGFMTLNGQFLPL